MLALAALASSADTPRARNTLLAVASGMNALDVRTATLAPGEPAATRIRAALTSGLFAAVAGYARTLPD